MLSKPAHRVTQNVVLLETRHSLIKKMKINVIILFIVFYCSYYQ